MKRMNNRVSITNFVHNCDVHIFDLYGFVSKTDEGAVPCRIKIGADRQLNVYVAPNQHIFMDYLATENGKLITLIWSPVLLQQDNDGKLSFDACQFLQERGKTITLCSQKHYTRWKATPHRSDTLLITPYGGARVRHNRGTGRYYVDLFFAPDTLTIDGQHTHSIAWETSNPTNSGESATVRSAIKTLLSGPHHFVAKDVAQRMKTGHFEGISSLCIRTDAGMCWLRRDFNHRSVISRAGQRVESFYPRTFSSKAFAEAGLKLMTCANVKGTVTRMCNLGLIERAAA